MTMGLSITGAIFINTAQNGLYKLLPNIPKSQVSQVISGTSSTLLATLPDDTKERALGIIVQAWRYVFVELLYCLIPVSVMLI